jgi:hypothetical protein
MARNMNTAQIAQADLDQVDEPEMSKEEWDELYMAESAPAGVQARINLASENVPGEIVILKGTRKERTYGHTEFTPAGAVFFWDGQAKATPEQKAELQKRGRIK